MPEGAGWFGRTLCKGWGLVAVSERQGETKDLGQKGAFKRGPGEVLRSESLGPWSVAGKKRAPNNWADDDIAL